MKSALKLTTIFIFISQVRLRTVSGQSQVSLRSVSGQSKVSLRSVSVQSEDSLRSVQGQSKDRVSSVPGQSQVFFLGLSELTSLVRRSLKYLVFLALKMLRKTV